MAKPGADRHSLMVYIDRDLYERLRLLAFTRRITLTQIAQAALTAWVTEAEAQEEANPRA